MPDAWDLAKARKAPGGKGVIVAVLDTGVAYQRFGRYRRDPDLNRFTKGIDYVDGDSHPNDENGHGTHVAGTIAQSTGNGIGAAGIAYEAKIMPVRVLDADGAGDTYAIARGIRYAVKHKAKVINMSLEFDASVRASQIPDLVSAMRYARQKGVLVVAAAGNQADGAVAYPARAKDAVAVSATTIRGCLADYSNVGVDVDLAAPGGGRDAALSDDPYDAATCRPDLAGPVHLPADLHQQRALLRAAQGLRGHLDGRPPRLGRGGAADRQQAAGPQPVAHGDHPPPGVHRARPGPARLRPALRLRPGGRRRRAALTDRTQVVLMIRTLQGAWWETLLGTEPSRKRLAPVMPLLPTTIRSAPFSSATSRIASAGRPRGPASPPPRPSPR